MVSHRILLRNFAFVSVSLRTLKLEFGFSNGLVVTAHWPEERCGCPTHFAAGCSQNLCPNSWFYTRPRRSTLPGEPDSYWGRLESCCTPSLAGALGSGLWPESMGLRKGM